MGSSFRHRAREGKYADGVPVTGYGLVSAVTGYSQEIADYDRATEFELLGGKLIDLSKSEWQELEAV